MKTQAAIMIIDESSLDFSLKMIGSNWKVNVIYKKYAWNYRWNEKGV